MANYLENLNSYRSKNNIYRRKLISLVKERKILWDSTLENFNRNPDVKRVAWREISAELGVPVEKLRRTWENLRYQYRRDFVRVGCNSKWRLYSEMNFISEKVHFRKKRFIFSDSEHGTTDSIEPPNAISSTKPVGSKSTAIPVEGRVSDPGAFAFASKNLQNDNIEDNKSVDPATTTTSAIHNVITSCSSTPSSASAVTSAAIGLPAGATILSKKFKILTGHTSQDCNVPATTSRSVGNSTPSVDLEFLQNSNSSNNSMPHNQIALPHEDVVVQEPNRDLELNVVNATKIERHEHTPRKDNEQNVVFQESHTSTSCLKRSARAVEEISYTSLSTPSHFQINRETNLHVNDDDYCFLMSLLPSLKQINKRRKFSVRSSIMDVIVKTMDQVYKE